ncbi:MAG: hypothetical protein ABW042_04305 [Phenylobacterium sp.]
MSIEIAYLAMVVAAFSLLAITLFTVWIWSAGGKSESGPVVTPARRPVAADDLDQAA